MRHSVGLRDAHSPRLRGLTANSYTSIPLPPKAGSVPRRHEAAAAACELRRPGRAFRVGINRDSVHGTPAEYRARSKSGALPSPHAHLCSPRAGPKRVRPTVRRAFPLCDAAAPAANRSRGRWGSSADRLADAQQSAGGAVFVARARRGSQRHGRDARGGSRAGRSRRTTRFAARPTGRCRITPTGVMARNGRFARSGARRDRRNDRSVRSRGVR